MSAARSSTVVLTTECPAAGYARPGEVIAQFSSGHGGGLISIREVPDGDGDAELRVELYRLDPDVRVTVGFSGQPARPDVPVSVEDGRYRVASHAQALVDTATLLWTRAEESGGSDIDSLHLLDPDKVAELFGFAIAFAAVDGGAQIAETLFCSGGRRRVIEAQAVRARELLDSLRDPT